MKKYTPPFKENREKPTAKPATGTEYYIGYLTGLTDAGWVCGDCGNVYEAKVTECPNRMIDQANADIRASKWRATHGA